MELILLNGQKISKQESLEKECLISFILLHRTDKAQHPIAVRTEDHRRKAQHRRCHNQRQDRPDHKHNHRQTGHHRLVLHKANRP